MARKRKPKPTGKARSGKQSIKDRYAHAREDAQLAGLIPTTPEEALKSEVVDPRTQGEQALPQLVQRAMTGWAVPAEKQPHCVDELVGIIENQGTEDNPPNPVVKVMAFNALVKGHALQHEIDNPKESKGTEVNVSIQNNVWQPIFQPQGQLRDEVEERLRELEQSDERSNEEDSRGTERVQPGGGGE